MSDFLYPFLSGDQGAPAELHDTLVASVRAKVAESAATRQAAIDAHDGTLDAVASAMVERFGAGGRLFSFGNGGSATDAACFAALLTEPPTGQPLPARSLSADAAVITALANDVGFARVFVRQLIAAAGPSDVAVGFSTSGNSVNVVQGLVAAADIGMLTVGFAGHDGGEMAACDAIDHLVLVRSDSVHRVQEAQAACAHDLWRRTMALLELSG